MSISVNRLHPTSSAGPSSPIGDGRPWHFRECAVHGARVGRFIHFKPIHCPCLILSRMRGTLLHVRGEEIRQTWNLFTNTSQCGKQKNEPVFTVSHDVVPEVHRQSHAPHIRGKDVCLISQRKPQRRPWRSTKAAGKKQAFQAMKNARMKPHETFGSAQVVPLSGRRGLKEDEGRRAGGPQAVGLLLTGTWRLATTLELIRSVIEESLSRGGTWWLFFFKMTSGMKS